MSNGYDPFARLTELISGIGLVVLTTLRPDRTIHSCPMSPPQPGEDGALWFLTSAQTDKVEAIRREGRVNVAFADPVANRYVSVSGLCELVRDHVHVRELWKSDYETWYPKGVEDPSLILLKIDVREVEYWDDASHSMVRLHGFARDAAAGIREPHI